MPPPIKATIEINDPNFSDPYYLLNGQYFSFSLKDATKPIIGYEVWVDGKQADGGSGGYANIYFSMNPFSYSNGSHQVDLKIKLATQSGSLAEHLNAEYYLVEKKFTIVIDPTPPPTISPTAKIENGFLTIRWNAIAQKNFAYTIKRTGIFPDSTIVNKGLDHFVDPGYVGGPITYEFRASGYTFYEKVLGTVTFNQPFDYQVSIDKQNIAHVSWAQTIISTENTVVTVSGLNSKTFPLTAPVDVSIDTLVLGDAWNYHVDIYRKGHEIQKYSTYKLLSTTPNLKPFVDYGILPVAGKLLIANAQKIYRYSLPDFTIEDSLSLQSFGASQALSSMRIPHNEAVALVVTDNSKLFKFDPLNFASRSQIDVSTPTFSAGGGNAPISVLFLGNISDNGLVTLTMFKSSYSSMLFDFTAGVVKWSIMDDNSIDASIVSNDGAYIVRNFSDGSGKVFKESQGTYNQIGVVAVGRKYFRTGTNELINETIIDQFAYPTGATISVYNLQSPPAQFGQPFAISRSMTYPYLSSDRTEYLVELGYDDFTKTFYTRHRDSYHSIIRLRDIDDFHYIKTMKAQDYTRGHVFSNNYHFVYRGFIEQVK
ncbi:MAG TPA: hypothetical protein VGQ59_10125 [Cyclobacteriaceae bacterium]|nr:hypothetical protein [Cyclobacteriaceae bacterium]